jgi:pimeloyl-ACP methyl ester carboxylesterase
MVKVFILLGGLIGPDGYAVSPGILMLAHRLDAFGEVTTHNWTAQREVTQRIANLDPSDKVVLIGYSGGGFAITQIADELNGHPPHKVDLLIAYDPSPTWSMASLGKNVAKAICYCNTSPLMLGLGGAQLRGQSVETVAISEQHLAVQFDQSLHKRTIAEIEKLAQAESGKAALAKPDPGKPERSNKR